MGADVTQERQQAHALLDMLPQEKLTAVVHLLQAISDPVARSLEAAGLVVEETIEREPYAPEVEYQSRRAYIFARKPCSV